MNHALQFWRASAAMLTRYLRFPGAALLCGTIWLATSSGAWAQQCNSSGFGIPFGTVSTVSNTDVAASLPYACQSNAKNTYYKVCLFIPGGTGNIAGTDPKLMQDYNGHYIKYNLYSDASRTQVIGPPPTGGGYTPYTWDFSVEGGYTAPLRTINFYGRVPPVLSSTPAGSYQAQLSGIVLQYAWSNTATPSNCFQSTDGGIGSAGVGFNGVTATVSNSCTVDIATATDMNFGTTSSLATSIDTTSTITLSCPANVNWKVGLNNGIHSLASQRRMAGPSADLISYNLYRDTSRTQPWGNDTTGGTDTVNGSGASQGNPATLTVYGRVPAQALVTPGNYSDTVTVTLVY